MHEITACASARKDNVIIIQEILHGMISMVAMSDETSLYIKCTESINLLILC